MLMAMAIVLGLFWVIAVGSSSTFGGYVHVLLIAAIVLGAFRYVQTVQGRRQRRVP